MFNANLIKQHCTVSDEGITLCINLQDEYVLEAQVQSITMFVSTENEGDEDEAEYYDGDLAVNWDCEQLTQQAANNIVDFMYSDGGWDCELADNLVRAGFSAEAAAEVTGSESGMQEEGRASYDAVSIGDEVRKAFGIV